MPEKIYEQSEWHGGVGDSLHIGFANAVFEGVGIDIFSEPGIVKVNQSLVKESGSTITSFCKSRVHASDGYSYWASDTGKVYRRSPTGSSWTQVHNEGAAILDINEFNGYIYFTTATALKRITTSNASSQGTWSVATKGTLTSASYHPMVGHGLYIFIGNDTTVASVSDADTFTADGTPDVTFAALFDACLGLFDFV